MTRILSKQTPSLWGRVGVGLLFLLCSLQSFAQDAFYIYRNDGDFNGYFFDNVQEIRVSKFDLDSIEHDVFVVQDIVTPDSTYRIPLAAIDSVGFQQPDIIISDRVIDLSAEDCPYKWYSLYDYHYYYNEWDDYMDHYDDDLDYVLVWSAYSYFDYPSYSWVSTGDKYLPNIGDVLLYPEWHGTANPFVGKVREIKVIEGTENAVSPDYYIICDPLESLGDIFENFISVEQIGTDESGNVHSRLAGLNKMKRRISGNKELSLVSLNGSFPIGYEDDNFAAKITIDLALSVKANAVYNISRKDLFIKVDFSEDAEVGASLTLQGKLEDALTWQLAGVPFYFPSFLPILMVKPGPGAFLKTTGDMSLQLSTPKLALHGRQGIVITYDGVTGSKDFSTGSDDDSNGWGLTLSLNGSAQTGVHMPFTLQTNDWIKKFCWASTGVDVYAGPKLEAHFALDLAKLAQGDAYSSLGNTMIRFTPKDFVIEGNANYKIGKKEGSYKIFEGEAGFGAIDLRLFPTFDELVLSNVQYEEYSAGYWMPFDHPRVTATVQPRSFTVPNTVGAAVYNAQKKLIYAAKAKMNDYSIWNEWTKADVTLGLNDGTYTVCPAVFPLGYPVPDWSSAKTVKAERSLVVSCDGTDGKYDVLPEKGNIYVKYVLNKDSYVGISLKSDISGIYPKLISREPMQGEDPNAEEYFEVATFSYELTDTFYHDVYSNRVFFEAEATRSFPESRERKLEFSFRFVGRD